MSVSKWKRVSLINKDLSEELFIYECVAKDDLSGKKCPGEARVEIIKNEIKTIIRICSCDISINHKKLVDHFFGADQLSLDIKLKEIDDELTEDKQKLDIDSDSQTCCSICMKDNIKKKDLVKFNCGHSLCKNDIFDWLEFSLDCVICRQKMIVSPSSIDDNDEIENIMDYDDEDKDNEKDPLFIQDINIDFSKIQLERKDNPVPGIFCCGDCGELKRF